MTTSFTLDYSANFSSKDIDAEMTSTDYSLTNLSGIYGIKEFLDYVCDYYTRNNGVKVSNMKAFQEDVLKATEIYIEKCDISNPQGHWGDGDSFDRESVRDILISQFGYVLTRDWNLIGGRGGAICL